MVLIPLIIMTFLIIGLYLVLLQIAENQRKINGKIKEIIELIKKPHKEHK